MFDKRFHRSKSSATLKTTGRLEKTRLNEQWDAENEFLVRLFELALTRAKQLRKKDYHPHDLYLNASSVLDAYEESVFE